MAYKKRVQGRSYPYLYNVSMTVGSMKKAQTSPSQADKDAWARMENNRIDSELREQQWEKEQMNDAFARRVTHQATSNPMAVPNVEPPPAQQEVDTMPRPMPPNKNPQYTTSYRANRRDDVMLVQYLLKRVYQQGHKAQPPLNQANGTSQLKIDGIYGPKTQKAITNFQLEMRKNGRNIATDGCIDPERSDSAIASISKTAYTISWLNKYFWLLYPQLAHDIRADPECPMELKLALI